MASFAANRAAFKVCFSGRTRLLARGKWGKGFKRIDEIEVGDEVASRNEFDPNGPIEWKPVEEVFRRSGFLLNLHLSAGENSTVAVEIETTAEHPFYERKKGWTAAAALEPGDEVRTDTGWTAVDSVDRLNVYQPVYNLRVSDHHTYFVGCDEWGFSVWAHNANCTPEQRSLLELEARSRGLIADGEALTPSAVARLQVEGDLSVVAHHAEWATKVRNAELLPGDQLAAFGGEPRAKLSLAAEAWLQDQGMQVLYRGHPELAAGQPILSDIAAGTANYRGATGLDASRQLAADLAAYSGDAAYAARLRATMHMHPGENVGMVPNRAEFVALFGGVPVGGAGIPFSSSMSVAAGYAQRPGTRLYATLQNIGEAIGPQNAWGRIWEREFVRLHEMPHSQIIHSFEAGRVPGVIPPGG